uniref:Secreted protein n=1 Tax=Loa loa TaxID=7209 RepID=A0A1I7VZP3_LOALO
MITTHLCTLHLSTRYFRTLHLYMPRLRAQHLRTRFLLTRCLRARHLRKNITNMTFPQPSKIVTLEKNIACSKRLRLQHQALQLRSLRDIRNSRHMLRLRAQHFLLTRRLRARYCVKYNKHDISATIKNGHIGKYQWGKIQKM